MKPLVGATAALALTAASALGYWTPGGDPMTIAAGDQRRPIVIGMPSETLGGQFGTAVVVWEDASNSLTAVDLYFSAIGQNNPPGTANAETLCVMPGWQTAPHGVFTGPIQQIPNPDPTNRSGIVVAWTDSRGGVVTDIYARKLFTAFGPWPSTGVPVCVAAGFQTDPQVAGSGNGESFIAWSDRRSGSTSDIYVQKLDADGAPLLAADGDPVCLASGSQDQLRMVSDGFDGVLLAWTDSRNPGTSRIFAQRLLPDGSVAPGWPIDGVRVCEHDADQSQPILVDDGSGGAIVAWNDRRAGPDEDVYAMHLTASGARAPGWSADGLPICTAAGVQTTADVVTDQAGGAIIVWVDGRDVQPEELSPDYDIFASRVRGDGSLAAGWTAQGNRVGGSPFMDQHPRAASDANLGVVVAWASDPGSDTTPDVMAQRLDATGAIPFPWPVGGLVVSAAPEAQLDPAVAGVGETGVFVAWEDRRNAGTTGSDVYATHFNMSGKTTAVLPPPASATLRLGRPRPNPSSREARFELALPSDRILWGDVVDVAGRRVSVLFAARRFAAGIHELRWDGLDLAGHPAHDGVYLLRVGDGQTASVVRVVVMH